MAKIVFGAAASHTPLLTFAGETWADRAQGDLKMDKLNLSDGRFVTYNELLAESGGRYADVATVETFIRKSEICQKSLDRLADDLEAAAPDVVIIVGDDQAELFGSENQPAISIFYGDEVVMHPASDEGPEWLRTALKGYAMDSAHRFPGEKAFALELIASFLDQDVDIATASEVRDPVQAGFGHAFGFIVKRLFKERSIPIIPILLNTYFPPNVLSASRCYDVGRKLRTAIEASSRDLRVAVIGSGGLSHFVVDEELDQQVLAGLQPGNEEKLRSLPRGALNSGSSEILNWVLTAGAVEHLSVQWSEYQPLYRTPAGTGVGAAFVVWGD